MDNLEQVPPQSKLLLFPRLLPQSPAVTAPSRRELFFRLLRIHIGLCFWESANCESLRCLWYQLPQAGSFGLQCRYRAGRRAAAVNACTVPMFSFPILLGNDTGLF